jgi:hypothetical protein
MRKAAQPGSARKADSIPLLKQASRNMFEQHCRDAYPNVRSRQSLLGR